MPNRSPQFSGDLRRLEACAHAVNGCAKAPPAKGMSFAVPYFKVRERNATLRDHASAAASGWYVSLLSGFSKPWPAPS
jgi:hypothetical protein